MPEHSETVCYLNGMAVFDLKLWKHRAQRRLKRTKDQAAFGNDLLAISSIKKINNWCKRRGIKVLFSREEAGEVLLDEKIIKISCRASPEAQLYWLLHECGHWLIDTCGDRRIRCALSDQEDERSTVTRVSVVNEEFEAWYRGERLADRLNVFVNKDRFDKQKADALTTYFRWASRTL